MKRSDNWLAAALVKSHWRYLHKQDFQDYIRLRLGLEPKKTAPKCVCGNRKCVIHAKNYQFGWYINLRHDSVRDYLHKKASMVFNDTEIEPMFKPDEDKTLNAKANLPERARSYIRTTSYERNFQITHLDIKEINVQAETQTSKAPKDSILHNWLLMWHPRVMHITIKYY